MNTVYIVVYGFLTEGASIDSVYTTRSDADARAHALAEEHRQSVLNNDSWARSGFSTELERVEDGWMLESDSFIVVEFPVRTAIGGDS